MLVLGIKNLLGAASALGASINNLEAQGGSISRLITRITGAVVWLRGGRSIPASLSFRRPKSTEWRNAGIYGS